jgi:thioredoxin reductase (NADPH)
VHRRDALRATQVVQDRAFKNPKIEFIWSHVVTAINGEMKVESITVESTKDQKVTTIPVDGVFLYVGLLPNTDYLKDFVDLDKHGYVLVNEDMKTSREGIYAAGDCNRKSLRQVVTAVSDGAIAAVSAEHYLEETGKAMKE